MRSEVATSHEPQAAKRGKRSGQAMVETAIVLVVLVLAFLAVFQFADNLRAKLLVDYAALRCARSRAVGYNDFTILKTARLCTLAVAGPARKKKTDGSDFSASEICGRMRTYLGVNNETQARNVLDYDYWNDGLTPRPEAILSGARIEAVTRQRRPQFFAPWSSSGEEEDSKMSIMGEAGIEAHYPDYLQ